MAAHYRAEAGVGTITPDAAAARLALKPGDRVLDIGCGTGSTTLALAAIVGPGGKAVGVDIAPAMVLAAQRNAAAAGVEHAEFIAADAQVDTLGAADFDAAYSRFGVMFFADADAAFANIHRSMRSGGMLAAMVACWLRACAMSSVVATPLPNWLATSAVFRTATCSLRSAISS